MPPPKIHNAGVHVEWEHKPEQYGKNQYSTKEPVKQVRNKKVVRVDELTDWLRELEGDRLVTFTPGMIADLVDELARD